MARQSFSTLQQETPENPGIASSAFPLPGGGITLLILGIIIGWLVVRDRNSPIMPDPNHGNQPHFTQALQWIAYSKALEKSQQYEQAIAAYDRGLTDFPHDFRLWHERGLLLAKLQLFEAALESYNRAYELKPNQPDLAHERGDALLQLKRYKEANASFDICLRYFPYSAHILADKGYALYCLAQYEAALKVLNQALNNATHDRNTSAYARFYQIESLIELGQFDAALQSSQQAMKLYPNELLKEQQKKLLSM
ncbi:tetratricopeptide repeat protein [Microseira wollei]|uniref:TPR domain protein n=1 Tax=Microseira wollei NIES-4236 TaxID=2530354 RepID=A0AAV3X525_9CYAN|nr:tetratricopeptide repeat protein [Microseira wollei]GET36336.1 TPR domain protein [Microseira wollei NIES-4236]